jgi:hypothetical protein
MLAKTDAPYSVIKVFWDPIEKYAFKSPAYVEKMFVDPGRGAQDDDISAKYLESFERSLQSIRIYLSNLNRRMPHKMMAWTEDELNEYKFNTECFWSEITEIRVSFKPQTKQISLDWILVRPCAEGHKFYSVILLWMAKICSLYTDINFVVSDCLEVNRHIMKRMDFLEEVKKSEKYPRLEYNYILSNFKCKQLRAEHFQLENKLDILDIKRNIIRLKRQAFPSERQLNDWSYVQGKFLNNRKALKHYMMQRFAAKKRLDVTSDTFREQYEKEGEEFEKKIMLYIEEKLKKSEDNYRTKIEKKQKSKTQFHSSTHHEMAPEIDLDASESPVLKRHQTLESTDFEPQKTKRRKNAELSESRDEIQSIVMASGKIQTKRLYRVKWQNNSNETWENREFFEENSIRRNMRDEYDKLIEEGKGQLVPKRLVTILSEDQNDVLYEIERIVAAFGNFVSGQNSQLNKRKYLVKWIGYDVPTWEPREIFDTPGLKRLLDNYDNLIFTGQRRPILHDEVILLKHNNIKSKDGVDYEALSMDTPKKDSINIGSSSFLNSIGTAPSSSPTSQQHSSRREVDEILACYGRRPSVDMSNPQKRRYLVRWTGSDELTWETTQALDQIDTRTNRMRLDYDLLLQKKKRRYIRIHEVDILENNELRALPGVDYKALSLDLNDEIDVDPSRPRSHQLKRFKKIHALEIPSIPQSEKSSLDHKPLSLDLNDEIDVDPSRPRSHQLQIIKKIHALEIPFIPQSEKSNLDHKPLSLDLNDEMDVDPSRPRSHQFKKLKRIHEQEIPSITQSEKSSSDHTEGTEIDRIIAAYGQRRNAHIDDLQKTRYLVKWKESDNMTWIPKEYFDQNSELDRKRKDYENLIDNKKRRRIARSEIDLTENNKIKSKEGVDYEELSMDVHKKKAAPPLDRMQYLPSALSRFHERLKPHPVYGSTSSSSHSMSQNDVDRSRSHITTSGIDLTEGDMKKTIMGMYNEENSDEVKDEERHAYTPGNLSLSSKSSDTQPQKIEKIIAVYGTNTNAKHDDTQKMRYLVKMTGSEDLIWVPREAFNSESIRMRIAYDLQIKNHERRRILRHEVKIFPGNILKSIDGINYEELSMDVDKTNSTIPPHRMVYTPAALSRFHERLKSHPMHSSTSSSSHSMSQKDVDRIIAVYGYDASRKKNGVYGRYYLVRWIGSDEPSFKPSSFFSADKRLDKMRKSMNSAIGLRKIRILYDIEVIINSDNQPEPIPGYNYEAASKDIINRKDLYNLDMESETQPHTHTIVPEEITIQKDKDMERRIIHDSLSEHNEENVSIFRSSYEDPGIQMKIDEDGNETMEKSIQPELTAMKLRGKPPTSILRENYPMYETSSDDSSRRSYSSSSQDNSSESDASQSDD